MARGIALDHRRRPSLLDRHRTGPDPESRFRAPILPRLADGRAWATVAAILS